MDNESPIKIGHSDNLFASMQAEHDEVLERLRPERYEISCLRTEMGQLKSLVDKLENIVQSLVNEMTEYIKKPEGWLYVLEFEIGMEKRELYEAVRFSRAETPTNLGNYR